MARSTSARSAHRPACRWFLEDEISRGVVRAGSHGNASLPLRRRRTRHSGAAEWLLCHDGAGGFIVDVVVSCSVPQNGCCLIDHNPANRSSVTTLKAALMFAGIQMFPSVLCCCPDVWEQLRVQSEWFTGILLVLSEDRSSQGVR